MTIESSKFALFAFVIFAGVAKYRSSKRKVGLRSEHSNSMEIQRKDSEEYVTPPLPLDVVRLLQASRLCHLATQGEAGEPHLSLMNFTYYQPDEVIIMGTSRSTSKFKHLRSISQTVSILIHDFPHLETKGEGDALWGKSFSITLKGKAEITEEGSATEEHYRDIHLKANPEYKQFSRSGAIVIVRVERARLCDINDRVTTWEAKSCK